MKQKSFTIETWVGLFLIAGLALVAGLVIYFGQFQDVFKSTYTFTVKFPNASGLLKGSDVYLSGAVIGKVITSPKPIPDTQRVEVQLRIDGVVKVRNNARFVIGSSGLLGDRFVDVQPVEYKEGTPESEKGAFVKDGEQIDGTKTTDLNELTNSAQPLIEKANDIANHLDHMITKLDVEVLANTTTDDLKTAISNLKNLIANANDLLNEAKNGKGALGRLINDRRVANDLADFAANLKKHGPVFYSDTAEEDRNGVKKNKK